MSNKQVVEFLEQALRSSLSSPDHLRPTVIALVAALKQAVTEEESPRC